MPLRAPHADGPCPMAVLKSLPAINTETKKAAYAAFLKIELIRRYRLQGTCHKVHATGEGFAMLLNDFSGRLWNFIEVIQHLQSCVGNHR